MSEQKMPDQQKVELEPIDMHGPILVTARAYVIFPDGRTATLSFQMEPGQIPTAAKIKATLDALASPEALAESSVPEGTRLMSKPEFVAHFTKQETGVSIPLPGDQHFVALPSEIPHGMLVHAIAGAGFGKDAYATPIEMTERGLAVFSGNQWNESWSWDKAALDKQPDDVLLAIYSRITQADERPVQTDPLADDSVDYDKP